VVKANGFYVFIINKAALTILMEFTGWGLWQLPVRGAGRQFDASLSRRCGPVLATPVLPAMPARGLSTGHCVGMRQIPVVAADVGRIALMQHFS